MRFSAAGHCRTSAHKAWHCGGFRPEGLLANYRMVRGQPRDFWIYALTRGGRATP